MRLSSAVGLQPLQLCFVEDGQIRKGYLYGNGKPGLGIDIDVAMAAKFPFTPNPGGGPYRLDRAMDGSVVKP